jgi:hypothetical protein
MKVDDQVRHTADELAANAASDDEKLKKIYDFCRKSIKNTARMTKAERAELKPNKIPSDTLQQRAGKSKDIALLFAALATAAGFDARYATLADRSEVFFDPASPNYSNTYFMQTHNIAVRVGDQWRFFDPENRRIPYGMLPWQQEGATALISDGKEPVFVKTPLSGPDKTLEKRRATFKVDEKGALEGDVTIEYTGHRAMYRRSVEASTAEKREADLSKRFKTRMSKAVLSEIKIQNVTDAEKPLIESFHIRVPGYAQRTGKRVLIPVAFFQRGLEPRFTANERRYPIYFHNPWTEQDSITIDLPSGYELDNAEQPKSFSFAPIGEYTVQAAKTKDGKQLVYVRQLVFGRDGTMLFPETSYASLKKVFDTIHDQDQHLISIKQVENAQ